MATSAANHALGDLSLELLESYALCNQTTDGRLFIPRYVVEIQADGAGFSTVDARICEQVLQCYLSVSLDVTPLVASNILNVLFPVSTVVVAATCGVARLTRRLQTILA